MDWQHLLSENRVRISTSPTPPGRSPFDLDYDRVVFSTPVRRLQDKAQVFPLEPNDSVRTRLTHSLEVSTVARSMALQAFTGINENRDIRPELKPSPEQIRHIEVIATTCGLIHDLGNPPFGHSGEDAIASWFSNNESDVFDSSLDDAHRADFLHFEGNAQTFRLITHLQVQADRHGFNFTDATLSATMKYLASSEDATSEGEQDSHRQERSKPGYFMSEKEVVERVQGSTNTGEARNPLAYLVEAADDAVYSGCDLEDAIRKDVLTANDALAFLKAAIQDDETFKKLEERIERLRPKGDQAIDIGLTATAIRIALHGIAIPQLIDAFLNKYDSIMLGEFHGTLEDACPIVTACRSVGVEHVYGASRNPELELLGRRIIHDLMDLCWEGIIKAEKTTKTKTFPQKIMSIISPNYVRYMFDSIDEGKQPERYCRLQLLTDFMCGMTDTFARDLHRRLFNG